MPRLHPVDPATAEGKSKELLDSIKKNMGGVPNIMATMVQAPAALQSYLGFREALAAASLSPQLREQIALGLAGENNCQYCASAHSMVGRKLGLSPDEITRNMTGESEDPKAAAAVQFARAIARERGWVSDEDMSQVRDAGYSDAEIVEIVAVTIANIFTNYFNHVAQTDIDFPKVEIPQPAGAKA